MSNLDSTLEHFKKTRVLQSILSLLHWDMESIMPEDSADLRSEQLAVLAVKIHEMNTDPEQCDRVLKLHSDPSLEGKNKKNIQRLYKSLEESKALDKSFVERMSRAEVQSVEAWKKAKEESNFKGVQKPLEDLLELNREKTQRFKEHEGLKEFYGESPRYEILLDVFEPGYKASELKKILQRLGDKTKELLPRVLESQKEMDRSTIFKMPVEQQEILSKKIVQALGFNLKRGRLDSSSHPFCGGHSWDTRLTTRYDQDNFSESLWSTIHEVGHALYEQNLPRESIFEPCGEAISFGVHESQSRFLENQICRSRAFCHFLSKEIDIDEKRLHAAINRVEKSFIRTEADELTYNLHILLRMELEEALINGQLQVSELPEAWDIKFENYFGLKPPTQNQGVLQDIHWYSGAFAYFPSYSVGNLLSGELFVDFEKAYPKWEDEIRRGNFSLVTEFMQPRVYAIAAFDDSPESIKKILGGRELKEDALIKYFEKRFLENG